MKINLSVLTVTHNSEKSVDKYLKSLQKYLPFGSEILIFDNNSQDATVEKIRGINDQLTLIESDENLGFSKGNNQLAKLAQGELLLFLNPDTELPIGTVDQMIEQMERDDKIGLVAPSLILPSGSIQPSVRKKPTLGGVIREYLLSKKEAFSEYIPASKDPVEVEAVYGAALLIRKELFLKLKGFNERYFLYYEDLDLCQKVREAGYKIIYMPNLSIKHSRGGSVVKSSQLPWGVRTLAHFIPMKSTGSYYYQVHGGYKYHGIVSGLLIRFLLWLRK